jgi:hypothetical protein
MDTTVLEMFVLVSQIILMDLSFRFRLMVVNTTFNNISVILWRSILLVEKNRVPGENHQPQGLVTIFIFFPSTLKTTREESKMSNCHTTLFQNSFPQLPSINAKENSSYKFKMLFPIAFHTYQKIVNKNSQFCTQLP